MVVQGTKEKQMNERTKFEPAKVGALLHELRIKQGLSVIEVAKRVGYSAEFVKMIEAEQVWPIEIGILLTFLDAMEYDWEIKPRPKNINEQLKASLKLEKKRKK
jgi:transcriptional regulator with XRE-family HTH domain